MTDKNGIINHIEDLLGSEGSTALAAAMLPLLERDGHVTFNGHDGYVMSKVDERAWLRLATEADEQIESIGAAGEAGDTVID